jgi:hypothetical protein
VGSKNSRASPQKSEGESLSKKISVLEQEVYDYIKEHGELIISNLPKNMMGAIPNLKNEGLVETFRKPVTQWASKKKTFVRALAQE